MSTQSGIKYCTYCDATIRGRSDKRFCNDACRNAYHNEMNKESSTVVHRINRSLKYNRKILSRFLTPVQETIEIRKDLLLLSGFNFMYFTHTMVSDGIQYHFCYDVGYQIVSDEKVSIVIEKNIVH